MFLKKYFPFLFLILLSLMLLACGKKGTDPAIPDGGLPSADIGNPGSGTEDIASPVGEGKPDASQGGITPPAGEGKPDASQGGITPPAGTSAPNPETQGSQAAATNDQRAAEDIPEQEQEVGRCGGEMLPVEPVNPAEYANFEKECRDYSPGDDHRGNTKEYALDENILYVKSFDFGDPLIYCLDLGMEDCYPLCSKPDCFHNSQTCNAFAESTAYETRLEYTGIAWINLYQDRLILYDAKKLFYRRLDGTGGEDIGSLMPNFNSSDFGTSGRTIMTHRGYVYTGQVYSTSKGTVIRFIRMSVSGGDLEVIWEHARPGIAKSALNMSFLSSYYGLGDKVYFFVVDERLANGGTSTRLYCYDTIKDEVSLYREFTGEIRMVYPRDGEWYYVYEDSLYSWNPATGNEHCIYARSETQYQELRYYNGGFCLWEETGKKEIDPMGPWHPDNVLWIHFYDWNGDYVTKIEPPFTPGSAEYYVKGFIGDYLIYAIVCKNSNEYQYYTAVLDTSRLGDPSLEWMVFELADYQP